MNDGIGYEDHPAYTFTAPALLEQNETDACIRPLDRHGNAEVLYVRGGRGVLLCGETAYPVRENDVAVIDQRMIHTIVADGALAYDRFLFRREDLLKNGLDIASVRFSPFPGRDEELIRRLDRVRESVTREPFLPEVNVAVLEVMLYLYQNHRKETPGAAQNDPVSLALAFLDGNWNRPFSVDEAAASAGVSKYHFMRLFKSATGKTPLTCLHEKRCRVAAQLLRLHVAPVSRIAALVGFETPSYFAKVFYSVTGKKPSEL